MLQGKSPPKPVIVRAGALYAFFIEYGTWKMAAQPFARPGLRKALAKTRGLTDDREGLIKLANAIANEWRRLAPVDTGALRDSIKVEK